MMRLANCNTPPNSGSGPGPLPELDPDQARYDYVYAVALHSAGRVSDAMTELKENLARHPDDRDTLLALITFSRDGGNAVAALEYAEQLARITPQDRGLAALIEELRRQTRKSSRDAADDHGSPPTTPQTGR
jgi:DNA-binding SARP family transcriptional activator